MTKLDPAQDWRTIPEHPNYEINALGTIRTLDRRLLVQQTKDANGNWSVRLNEFNSRTSKIRRTSYLVAITFHPEGRPQGLSYARCKLYLVHHDSDPNNLSATNVDWYQAAPGDPPAPDDEPTNFEPMYPEKWRIYSDNPRYSVSNYGRIRSRGIRHRVIQNYLSGKGHIMVVMRTEDGKTTSRHMNHIVAETFVPKDKHPNTVRPRGKDEVTDSVWHIDGDITNCRADNLLWETRSRVIEWNKQNRPDFDQRTHDENGKEFRRHRMVKATGHTYRSMEELAVCEGVLLSDVKYVYYSLAEYVGDPNQIYTVV